MDENNGGCSTVLFALLGALSGFLIVKAYVYGEKEGYLDACKDFSEGKIKGELKTLPGGEKKWVLKK